MSVSPNLSGCGEADGPRMQSLTKGIFLMVKSLEQKNNKRRNLKSQNWKNNSTREKTLETYTQRCGGDMDAETRGLDITTTQQGQRRAQRLIYTHREDRGNWTQVDLCRQSQTGSEERKHRRNRHYKIKQETEHREWANQRHRKELRYNHKHKDKQEHEVIIKQKTLLIKRRKHKDKALKKTKPWQN